MIDTENIKLDINKRTVVYDDGDWTCNYIVTAEYEDSSVIVKGLKKDNTILSAIDKLYEKVKLLNIYKAIPKENIKERETVE